MKKGFTLVEVLAVIILLGLISILAFPSLLNSINKTKGELSEASKKVLFSAAKLYVSDNLESFPKVEGNNYCITIKKLSDAGSLPNKVYDIKGNEIDVNSKISISVRSNIYEYKLDNKCENIIK